MNTLLVILKKEFLQIFRNKLIFGLLSIVPFCMLGILPHAINHDISIRYHLIDYDHSTLSKEIGEQMKASSVFKQTGYGSSYKEALRAMDHDQTEVIVEIPLGYEQGAQRGLPISPFVTLDATNTLYVEGQLYAISSILTPPTKGNIEINPILQLMFNPKYDSKLSYIISLIVLIITLIGVCLTTINMVNEKEKGNQEQIYITPITKFQYLFGKMVPFFIICFIEFFAGLVFCHYMYGLDVVGSVLDLVVVLSLFLFCILGMGFLISLLSDNQMQAMYVIMFVLLTLVLMSTMFSDKSSMPEWGQMLCYANPIYYVIDASRLIIMKGFSMSSLHTHIIGLAGFAVLINFCAILNVKKIIS